MDISTLRVRSRRATLLAVGAGLLSTFSAVGSATAAEPVPSQACVNLANGDAADGKISGSGATFAKRAQDALIAGYRSDVCGQTMVFYNQPFAGFAYGSGDGQRAASWRRDAFSGTDIPYDQPTLNLLNGPCGTLTKPTQYPVLAPFTPESPLGPFPDGCTDPTPGPVMSFPTAGAAVSLAVNLNAAACGGTAPGTLRFTNLQASRILGGDVLNWNAPFLRTGGQNAGLVNCNVPIVRVARFDRSGTTQIVKNYLARADSARSGATCDSSRRWGVQPGGGSLPDDFNLDAQNRDWPNSPADPGPITADPVDVPATATCSAINRGSGTTNLLNAVVATSGGVGYADLPDVVARPTLLRPELRNGTNTGFQSPLANNISNCSFSGLTRPGGGSPDGSAGLAPGDNWGSDVGPDNHSDATLTGARYPLCGLTFVLVYTGLSDTTGGANAITRMTANQRRTLYGYFTYVLTPQGQSRLTAPTVRYAALPNSWLDPIRQGFQANF